MSSRVGALLFSLAMAPGCTPESAPPGPQGLAPGVIEGDPFLEPSASADAIVSSVRGGPAASAPRGARAQAVLALLSGGEAGRLPVVATPSGPPPPPEVQLGQPKVTGALPWQVVFRIMRHHVGNFRHCFEQSSRPAGKVSIEFVIDKSGKTVGPKASSKELHDPALLQCFSGATSKLSFPAPEQGSASVQFDVTLSPDS